jgi:POT family proton-dependent oligopeptide transporter
LIFGCFGVALGYVVMAWAAYANEGGKASWLWLALYFAVITYAELYFSPIALSLVSMLAPESSRSAMMGLWFTTNFVGNLLAGWLGGFWSSLSHVGFFLVTAGVAAFAGALIAASRGLLRDLLAD